ncbi:hypothetical protein HPB48_008864 [Haemaphysalis longicornis]|uniref:Uncharacterized protein n=1 Tax=Haemaphysalis longicornis TaxID=44386 RepID=A0A9J6GZ89_HAELO|nr:hypothetical protein HPB48_008864 [Haemaphysalis longicornis]
MITDVVKKGPRYSEVPDVQVHKLLVLNRRFAKKADSERQEHCVLKGVDSLAKTVPKPRTKKRPLKNVLHFLEIRTCAFSGRQNGDSVVVPEGVFSEKADQAISKNFRQVKTTGDENTK